MTEANNQPAGLTAIEQTRVTSITVERLFNLGNYENIKYGVRAEVAVGDDPNRVITSLERIMNDLRPDPQVSSYELHEAKRILATPESELSDYEKSKLDLSRERVRRCEETAERRRKARAALATLNYTVEHRDHKQDWDDDGYVEY